MALTALTAWLRAAELTEPFECGRRYDYDEVQLRAALPELWARAARPDKTMLRDIAGLLAKIGVVFMVVEPPKSFPLLGMTRWIDKRVPVIQQTGRWGKDGFVTWTLFHELGHVLNDPRGEMHLEYKTEKKRTSVAEKGANQFAFETLFGEDGIEPFRGLTHNVDIVRTARQVGISPGVAVHQMHANVCSTTDSGTTSAWTSKAASLHSCRQHEGRRERLQRPVRAAGTRCFPCNNAIIRRQVYMEAVRPATSSIDS
ncbi:ImmA/IrrE family metallo-endopeptidase [Mycobacteroides abscessus]